MYELQQHSLSEEELSPVPKSRSPRTAGGLEQNQGNGTE